MAALSLLGLTGCGDQSSERQFAGDPRTTEAGDIETTETEGIPPSGSPTAVATAVPVSELLAPRGDQRIGIVVFRHEIRAIDIASGDGASIWSNPERSVWAAHVDSTSEHIAALTSGADGAYSWSVEFVPADGGEVHAVAIGDQGGDKLHHPDAVAGGRGGIEWLPDSSSVVISLPTGGLLQVFPDGSQVKLAKASAAKRPAALAVSPDGSTIAFVDQPSGSDGSGIYAGSMKAKPIDPIVVLPADRSGNRYAREIAWIGSTARVATIIERDELGNPQGDLFYLDTKIKRPQLAWTSPAGRDVASVTSFAISNDALVTAFVTNPARSGGDKPSSLWLKQTDGPSIERFDLPVALSETRVSFTPDGVAVTGIAGQTDRDDGLAAAYLLESNGALRMVYQQQPAATPVGSPVASPQASPVASPVGSPSPVAVTTAG